MSQLRDCLLQVVLEVDQWPGWRGATRLREQVFYIDRSIAGRLWSPVRLWCRDRCRRLIPSFGGAIALAEIYEVIVLLGTPRVLTLGAERRALGDFVSAV